MTSFASSNLRLKNRVEDAAHRLQQDHGCDSPQAVITAALDAFGKRFAIVSSFGAESAVLLHQASEVSKDIPILFLDTGKLFGETRRYRDQLQNLLGLTNVHTITPDGSQIVAEDPKGDLWKNDHNRCCFVRKVIPFKLSLDGFDAWASGRKRFQTHTRATIDHFEYTDGRITVNPLALWSSDEIRTYIARHNLPSHPLIADGFKSIGCMPCTDRVADNEDDRSGRWRNNDKTECGIHLTNAQNQSLTSSAL